ncbi:MAG: methyltransferase [Lachnospiraceae bacterium]|nr:methyltransferase [Lachnospiraceae bacterium]
MTSRELVYSTLEFRNTQNRAPRELWSLKWAEMFQKEDYDRIVNKYIWDIDTPKVIYKECSTVESGDPYVVGEYVDVWGCKFKSVHAGIIGEVKEPIVTDDEWNDISNVVFPENLLSFDIEQVNEECAKSDKFMLSDFYARPFERLQFIRGTENLYMDLMFMPQGLVDFIEKMHQFYCRVFEKWAMTDVDALWFMDDWGSQKSLLINPKLWREIFKPMYKDYVNIAHSHGKKIFMHSDGYILDIIPDLIEIGVDAVNSQIFCMGVENLSQFKGKITFWGEICRQHIIPNGSPDDVKTAVKSVYDHLWDNGGCIAQCEYGPAANPNNVDLIYETWNKLTE